MLQSNTPTRYAFFILLLLLSRESFADNTETLKKFEAVYAEYNKLSGQNKWKQSLPSAKKAYELGLTLYDAGHENIAALTHNYGLNLVLARQREKGVEMLLEAVSAYEAAYGEQADELAPVLMDIADSLPHKSGLKSRLKYITRALALTEEKHGKKSREYGRLSVQAGVTLMQKEKNRLAKSYLKKGYKIALETEGESGNSTAYAAFNLGKYEMMMRRNKSAVGHFNNVLQSFEDPDKPSNRIELATHGFLVSAYEKMGKRESATKHCLAIGRMTPAGDNQNYQPLFKEAPQYPREAALVGSTGYVIVRYDVDDMGFVRNPEITENTGHESLKKASLEAAKKFRYAPRFVDGKPVTTSGVRNRFNYTLD